MKKYVDGILMDMTAEEETLRDTEIAAWNNGSLNRALEKLREKRNSLLIETDWLANSDVTMSSAMTTYRQALRDITNGLTTVEQIEAVIFPTKPV
jgi:hypothetical protein